MRKVRAVVAKTNEADGLVMILARGSIKGGVVVPITVNFDRSHPPIGTARIEIDGDNVIANMEIVESYDRYLGGRLSIGGVLEDMTFEDGQRTCKKFAIMEVSVKQ